MAKKENGMVAGEAIQTPNESPKRKEVTIQIGNRSFVKKPLPANTYFGYQRRLTTHNQEIAILWLMYEAYGIGEEEFQGLRFREKGRLQAALTTIEAEVICHDDLPFSESSDFSVLGHRYTEKPNSGDYYTKFVQQSNQGAIAYKEAIQSLFLIDGRAIEDKDFSEPEGIGYGGAVALMNWINFIFSQTL
ncbi:MAG: hypothetical protein F6K14_10805 [Symploca sp. SIO2C1]|nr:hypothetical protein [Symploca sp. SIO2C1]